MNSTSTDLIQPFYLETPGLRGRIVRISQTLNAILARHDYPNAVARLLSETVALTALLSAMLKYEGVFTLQAKGEGAVRLLVADIDSAGNLRAYAQYDADQLLTLGGESCTAGELLGEGYLAFTVDQGVGHDRYQGVVELEGNSMADFAQAYFRRSEQIDTAFKIEVAHDEHSGWSVGGVMLQRLPEDNHDDEITREDETDDWRRAMVLMATATADELTDATLSLDNLLYRLFHEEEVRVYTPSGLFDQCRCSRQRVAHVLGTLPEEERQEMLAKGEGVEVRCEFCSRVYAFTPGDIKDHAQGKAQGVKEVADNETRH